MTLVNTTLSKPVQTMASQKIWFNQLDISYKEARSSKYRNTKEYAASEQIQTHKHIYRKAVTQAQMTVHTQYT